MKKWIIILAIAGGLTYAGKMYFTRATETAPTYSTGEITQGDIEYTISSTGTLSAVETVNVGAQVSGILKSVNVDYNDTVIKDQVLAVLDTALLEVSVQDADANVKKALAQVNQAQAELRRNTELFNKGFLSESEYLVLQTNVEVAKAGLEGARAALLRAQTNLNYAVIKSPVNGTIIERSVDEGQTIASSLQAPQLFIIAEDLKRMQIEVYVDESDIGQIKEEQIVRFTVQAYPNNTFTGVVRQIRLQPETIQNVVNYVVVVNVANDDNLLLPGMTATVDFIIQSRTNAMLIPNAALSFKPDEAFLAQIAEDRPEQSEQSGKSDGKRRQNSRGKDHNGRPHRPKDVAGIFWVDSGGKSQKAMIRTGITDGIKTEIVEILRGGSLPEGTQVITGLASAGSSKSEQNQGFMLPMGGHPRGGRGMRRAGL